MAKKKSVDPTYESSMQELQSIIQDLQEDQLNLDELSAKVKHAHSLIQTCRTKLRSTKDELKNFFDGME